jgi:altronate hydrolase
MPDAMQVHAADTVAVALRPLRAGEQVALDGARHVLADDIPQGHKFALTAHGVGDCVVKYGLPIGRASAAIAPGAHIHSHNLVTALVGEEQYALGRASVMAAPATIAEDAVWQGYRRATRSGYCRRWAVWRSPPNRSRARPNSVTPR